MLPPIPSLEQTTIREIIEAIRNLTPAEREPYVHVWLAFSVAGEED